MADFQTVARVGEIPKGEGRPYPVNGRIVGVFHVDDGYFAINDFCPHMGASLSSGYVEGTTVYCPWHAWRFCIRDGTWLDNPSSKVRTDSYEVRLQGDEIQVLVPDPPPRTPLSTAT
ncbi:MAG: Rieske 2Fe-2S domain-containing protein [Planctomyces sp.]|nr:Rieske 2Fe-2S domain-containing protein [Planctomyces sp.]